MSNRPDQFNRPAPGDPRASGPLVQLTNVTKSFASGDEHITILDAINFTAPVGKILAITGESGSGKSTLLNIIGGLDYPTEGIVRVNNRVTNKLSEYEMTRFRSRDIGFIFQFHHLMKDFTAIENVMLPAYIAHGNRRAALRAARELLKEVRMEKRADHYPNQLSGGERQRIAVARALINSPPLILADEPTGNLDERNSRQVEFLLFFLARRQRKTLIIATHDINLTKEADIHLRIEHGKLHFV